MLSIDYIEKKVKKHVLTKTVPENIYQQVDDNVVCFTSIYWDSVKKTIASRKKDHYILEASGKEQRIKTSL